MSTPTPPDPDGMRIWRVLPAEHGDSPHLTASVSVSQRHQNAHAVTLTDQHAHAVTLTDQHAHAVTLTVTSGRWPLAQARRLAAAILAAAEHAEHREGSE